MFNLQTRRSGQSFESRTAIYNQREQSEAARSTERNSLTWYI